MLFHITLFIRKAFLKVHWELLNKTVRDVSSEIPKSRTIDAREGMTVDRSL